MRRTVVPIAAILLTAACGPAAHHASAAPTPASQRTSAKPSSKPAATHAKAHPRTAAPKPSSSTKECPPTRDIIVWVKTPGTPAYAQELGNYNLATCESTFKWLQRTSPTDAGNCTEAAWASDNRGYNTDADPAPRLKKVQMLVGPAC
ncbi:hypothetical protein [Streptomyces sp. NPDC091215]|uniref:hypothetical protein n=1 Tax=Streptomyces sp. NPDC091215 TaxID=3155192 RepID=UPI003433E2A3